MKSMKLGLVLIIAMAGMVAEGRAVTLGPEIVISVKDQELAVLENGKATDRFAVSTSRFGVGDEPNSYKTPLGMLWVYDKIGDHLPEGAVIKNRSATGEVIPANARGRDPIVTRIIWLKGLFGGTTHAFERCIYIHGTPEETTLGRPVSWGCIRMRSADVLRVYGKVQVGTHVLISDEPMKKLIREEGPNTLDMPAA
jgi:lipoprotein-anchoring transpeptidase ErfK/SrfK